MAAPIERLDVPAEQLAAESVLRESMALHARAGDWDADEYLSAREAIQLVTHPDVPVSTDADYPNWTCGGRS